MAINLERERGLNSGNILIILGWVALVVKPASIMMSAPVASLGLRAVLVNCVSINRVLDAGEIEALATPRSALEAPVPVLDGATVHYRFEEQTGSQIKDLAIAEGTTNRVSTSGCHVTVPMRVS